MTEDKRKCEYSYKTRDRKCPRNALPDSKFCFWHEEREGKDLHNQNLKNEDLSETYLFRANLADANLQRADLHWANLGDANLQRADLYRADLTYADLQRANLDGANLQKANLTLANLKGAYLCMANLQESLLFDANLEGAYLGEADLEAGAANLQGAYLNNANLQRADLYWANLQGADLSNANLQGADLSNANLEGANFWDAYLQGADLRVANIIGARNLRYAKLDEIIISEKKAQKIERFKNDLRYYYETIDVYINLKNYFREDGLYDLSGMYYIREGIAKGKIQRIASKLLRNIKNISTYDDILLRFFPFSFRYKDSKFFPILLFLESKTKWVFNRFLDHTSKYGESPFRVIVTSLIIISIYSILYWLFSGITIGCLNFHPSFFESLNYSIATFTTFRYGNYYPKPSFQLVATSEAFIGVFMIAFFVVVVSRKIIR